MRIEINAGGLGGSFTVASMNTNLSTFITDSSSVISSFKTVGRKTCSLNGGVGTLQDALSLIDARASYEERKKQAADNVKRTANDFIDLAVRIDKNVATLVQQNQKAFYQKYPHLQKRTSLMDRIADAISWVNSDAGKMIGKIIKTIEKLSKSDDVKWINSVWKYFSKILKCLSPDQSILELYKNAVGVLPATEDVYSAFFEYLKKGKYGHDLGLKYSELFVSLAVLGEGFDFGLAGVDFAEAYEKYKNGEMTEEQFLVKLIELAQSGTKFGGGIFSFWNHYTPGQVEILEDGTITNGMVENTEFLKEFGSFVKIIDAAFEFTAKALEKGAKYNEDGTITLDETSRMLATGSLYALFKLIPLGFLAPDSFIDGIDDYLMDDYGKRAAQKLSENRWVVDYTSRNDNSISNNVITRGVIGGLATGWAMLETVVDDINRVFDITDEWTEESVHNLMTWLLGHTNPSTSVAPGSAGGGAR